MGQLQVARERGVVRAGAGLEVHQLEGAVGKQVDAVDHAPDDSGFQSQGEWQLDGVRDAMRESGRTVRLHQVRVIGERRFQVADQIGGIRRLAVAGAQAGPSQRAVQGGSTGDGGTRPPGQPSTWM